MNIIKPTLLIDPQICKDNIGRMAEKASRHGVLLRPHFKTHQSRMVGDWNKDFGIEHITVSSMDMLEYFSGHYRHITLAIPFNMREMDRLNRNLGVQKIAILTDTIDTINQMKNALHGDVGIWIEIDTGSKRSGLSPDQVEDIRHILDVVESIPRLHLEGLYSHAGHTYSCRGAEEIRGVFENARTDVLELREKLGGNIRLNLGDTPGCTVSDNFEGLHSISPGNFVFYDTMQVQIGSCEPHRIGVCLAAPIISKNPQRREFVIYGGGIHLSKDRLQYEEGVSYGTAVPLLEYGWGKPLDGCFLKSISQEHGVMRVSDEVYNSYNTGDLIGILPVHSCMTADCMGSYLTPDGKRVDHMREKR